MKKYILPISVSALANLALFATSADADTVEPKTEDINLAGHTFKTSLNQVNSNIDFSGIALNKVPVNKIEEVQSQSEIPTVKALDASVTGAPFNNSKIEISASSVQQASTIKANLPENNNQEINLSANKINGDQVKLIQAQSATSAILTSSNVGISQNNSVADLSDEQERIFLAILTDISYRGSFREQLSHNLNKMTVYQYALNYYENTPQSDLKKEREAAGLSGAAKFDAEIKTIITNQDFFDHIVMTDFKIDESAGKGTPGDYINTGYVTYMTLQRYDDKFIIYPGTSGDLEWYDTGLGVSGTDTPKQITALNYFDQQFSRDQTSNYYLLGSSKGGNKAMYVGFLRGDKIAHVFSFGGQGFSKYFADKYSLEIEKNKNKVTEIAADMDPIAAFFNQYATVEYYLPPARSLINIVEFINPATTQKAIWDYILELHGPVAITTVAKDGTLKLDDRTKKSMIFYNSFSQFVNDFLNSVSKDDAYRVAANTIALPGFMLDSTVYYNFDYLNKLIQVGLILMVATSSAIAVNPLLAMFEPSIHSGFTWLAQTIMHLIPDSTTKYPADRIS